MITQHTNGRADRAWCSGEVSGKHECRLCSSCARSDRKARKAALRVAYGMQVHTSITLNLRLQCSAVESFLNRKKYKNKPHKVLYVEHIVVSVFFDYWKQLYKYILK